MIHTESIGLTSDGFAAFADLTGHPPLVTPLRG
jgi:hypothetical protein